MVINNKHLLSEQERICLAILYDKTLEFGVTLFQVNRFAASVVTNLTSPNQQNSSMFYFDIANINNARRNASIPIILSLYPYMEEVKNKHPTINCFTNIPDEIVKIKEEYQSSTASMTLN